MAWGEVNFEEATWTVPGERMKLGKTHIVPLSTTALAILKTLKQGEPQDYVFSTYGRSPLSDMTLAAVIKRMNEKASPEARYLDPDGRAISPHGFRSSFRVWAAEEPNHPKDVAEFALAHKLPDPVEAAYQRSTLFEARKSLMQSWDDWVTGQT